MTSEPSILSKIIRFCLQNKLVVFLFLFIVLIWGVLSAPFDWKIDESIRNPVPVDAIPDIGENQQIVFTKWTGRSPQDVEDQITYPLTVALLGVPGVKTIRSYSYFGFSSVYAIFHEKIDFYWSRSRILEKLNSLPPGTLPPDTHPTLGPDATALGQIFWYTLEGHNEKGEPTGGWDLHELRSTQDYYVRYHLQSAQGISEVSSIGGFVQEYQIDVDPDAMRAHGVSLPDIFKAVKSTNIDVGARTIEINRVEYMIRGLGFIKSLKDLEETVVKVRNNIPISIKDIAIITLGPALRRGALDKEGAETVGGVVVVRFGYNPLEAIKNVKEKIKEIAPGLPSKTLRDGTVSKVTIVPFYDRTELIHETLGTLETALTEEILITIVVVLLSVLHLRSALVISGLLPVAVLMTFIGMKFFRVDANIMALAGIVIAIGTMVDMGIILCENIFRHLKEEKGEKKPLEIIYQASLEVGGAVLTAVATTVVSFLPVFAMSGPEGKLFKPLAYTKTFALIASIVVALALIPPITHLWFSREKGESLEKRWFQWLWIILGIWILWAYSPAIGLFVFLYGTLPFYKKYLSHGIQSFLDLHHERLPFYFSVSLITLFVTSHWLPLGPEQWFWVNFLFVVILIGGLLGIFYQFQRVYPRWLTWALHHKQKFMLYPLSLLVFALLVWQGTDRLTLGISPKFIDKIFPGLGKEFMPSLDEGSFLYMPTTMPHASIGESLNVLQTLDRATKTIPEVQTVVGKLGRADSPLDPAPISMFENVILYQPEYKIDKNGRRLRFKYRNGKFLRDTKGELISSRWGKPYRNWRPHIRSTDDIWNEIVKKGKILGTTSAPKLQPIAARIVMLQSGMRAPMGIKIKGPDLKTIESVGLQLEKYLKEVSSIEPTSVVADRIVGKPYLEIDINRKSISRYGLSIRDVQDVIEIAIGGKRITTTVEGRERYPVRIRYQRELRDTIESLEKIYVPTKQGAQIPLNQLAKINYVRGPQVIKSEDTFLVGYVIFDKKEGFDEVGVVNHAKKHLIEKIKKKEFILPPNVSYSFTGSYENQVRSEKRLLLILPITLFVIFLILYFQFKRVDISLLVFSGVLVAWSGGFILLWLYGQDWFFNIQIFGVNLRDLFQMRVYNLSIAVWVGFIALFGIATDNGVVLATYLEQLFKKNNPKTKEEIQKTVLEAAKIRLRPCLMTSATTILALLPVLSSTGRGSDILVPMAIPSFGGMTVQILTVFMVPVLYCWIKERKISN